MIKTIKKASIRIIFTEPHIYSKNLHLQNLLMPVLNQNYMYFDPLNAINAKSGFIFVLAIWHEYRYSNKLHTYHTLHVCENL